MVIYEALLTTFEASFIFESSGAVTKICSSLKQNHHYRSKIVEIPEIQSNLNITFFRFTKLTRFLSFLKSDLNAAESKK